MGASDDKWLAGDAYEAYGRWSRALARRFVEWLRPTTSAHWLDLGCGTGAPSHLASLDQESRESLRARLRRRLHTSADERILLRARAWAVRGIR